MKESTEKKLIGLLVAAMLAGVGWYLRENAQATRDHTNEVRDLRAVVAEAQKDLAVAAGALERYLVQQRSEKEDDDVAIGP